MRAPRPAARPAHPLAHFIEPHRDAAIPGLIFLGRNHPTNPLIAHERCNIVPEILRIRIGFDRGAKICRYFMHHAIGGFSFGHGTILANSLFLIIPRPTSWTYRILATFSKGVSSAAHRLNVRSLANLNNIIFVFFHKIILFLSYFLPTSIVPVPLFYNRQK